MITKAPSPWGTLEGSWEVQLWYKVSAAGYLRWPVAPFACGLSLCPMRGRTTPVGHPASSPADCCCRIGKLFRSNFPVLNTN